VLLILLVALAFAKDRPPLIQPMTCVVRTAWATDTSPPGTQALIAATQGSIVVGNEKPIVLFHLRSDAVRQHARSFYGTIVVGTLASTTFALPSGQLATQWTTHLNPLGRALSRRGFRCGSEYLRQINRTKVSVP